MNTAEHSDFCSMGGQANCPVCNPLSDEELDALVAESIQNAKDNGYEEEMRGWTSYEHAIDLCTCDADLEKIDVFVVEASVKRYLGEGFVNEH